MKITIYRVVDCRTLLIDPEHHAVKASSPEEAALLVTGERLVRGANGAVRKKRPVLARVHWQGANATTMVRLYGPAVE